MPSTEKEFAERAEAIIWRLYVLEVFRKRGFKNMTTIYEALKTKLGREPTHKELCDDVKRILEEGTIERAGKGKLKHQKKG